MRRLAGCAHHETIAGAALFLRQRHLDVGQHRLRGGWKRDQYQEVCDSDNGLSHRIHFLCTVETEIQIGDDVRMERHLTARAALNRRRRQRQADLEAAWMARLRGDDRLAAMKPRDLPDQSETEAHAPGIAAQAMERRKHPLA